MILQFQKLVYFTFLFFSNSKRAQRALWMAVFATFATCNSFAQGTAPSLTLEDYKKFTTYNLGNPEEDTYVKFESTYVLDRESKPYVFNYSDGVERKIYMYKLLKGAEREEVGTMAVYATPKTGKMIKVCIPGPKADKKVWDYYIDELKHNGEQENGFLSTLAFVLSREYSREHANAGKGPNTVAKDDGDKDFCFPAGALVTMADGTVKPIEQVKAGDKISTFDSATNATAATTVTGLQAHYQEKGFALTKLLLLPTEEVFASTNTWVPAAPLELVATSNHPLLTAQGKKEMGQIAAGDILYHFDSARHAFREYRVVANLQQAQDKVQRVYNLETTSGNYLINNTVVLDK